MTITVHIRDKQRFFENVTCQNNDGILYILDDSIEVGTVRTLAVFKKWDYYIVD